MRRHPPVVAMMVFVLLATGWWLAKQPARHDDQTTLRHDLPAASDVPTAVEQTVPHRPRENAGSGDGFVGSDACRDCHADQYQSWHDSYHRRMTQLATPESVIGNFQVPPVQAYQREFILSRRGDEFWVNMHDPDIETTDNAARIDRQIVLTTGSHHMQIYWYATGENATLAQLPVAWLRETNAWVPTSALFISPPGQPLRSGKRRWNEVCIKCHTTHGQPRIDESEPAVVDTQVAEFGISCEACHGPGETHVSRQRGVAAPAKTGDDVLQPERLDHRTSSQICGQCHGIWIEKDATQLTRFLWHGRSFRAGDQLSETGYLFGLQQPRTPFIDDFLARRDHYLEDRFWSDGMPRVSGSEYNGLARSACHTQGTMSCLACHQMHQQSTDLRSRAAWADDQMKSEMLGQEACLQCHASYREVDAQTKHTHHNHGSSGSLCTNCHMPHTTYGLLKAIRSHQISSPNVQESVDIGRPNACNQCHLDKSLQWTANRLESWYAIPAPANMTADQQHYAASLLWGLRGDAGQRALAAWCFGWEPAQQASRTDWLPPILAQLLTDPYDAVRHSAHRSLKTLPGFADIKYHYTGSSNSRERTAAAVFQLWQRSQQPRTSGSHVLLGEDGNLLRADFTRLFQARDNREMLLAE